MKQYHKVYKEMDPRIILAVKTAIKSGLFKKENSVEFKIKIINDLHSTICQAVNIPVCPIILDLGEKILGHYNRIEKVITINKPSLVTYLHEFCHYFMDITGKQNNEEIARGWSISLFYLATPKLCKNAIEKGLILYQTKFEEDENVQH